jgi:hypothetical protein
VAEPMKRVVDDHGFTVDIPHTNGPNCCRLQIFTATGRTAMAVATQDLPPATGASLTNAAERFAQEAWRRHLPGQSELPQWIQHYTSGTAAWMEVLLEVDAAGQLTTPSWVGITPERLAELVGQPVEPGRGERYVAAQSTNRRGQRLVSIPSELNQYSVPVPTRKHSATESNPTKEKASPNFQPTSESVAPVTRPHIAANGLRFLAESR